MPFAFTNIPNGAVAQGGLPSGETVTALRDNPLAMFEGASGAPRLWLPGIERLTAGDDIRSRNASAVSASGTQSIEALSFSFIQHGDIRVKTTISAVSGTRSLTVVRIRAGNSTTLATYTAAGAISLDVSVIPGDRIRVMLSTATGGITATNTQFCTNGNDLWPGPDCNVEGNRVAP